MHSAETNSWAKRPLNLCTVRPRFGSAKLASTVRVIGAILTLTIISGLSLMAASPAQAQDASAGWTVWNFTGGSDGAYPESNLIADKAGNLYGTTNSGGAGGHGTVYEVSYENETTLYNFCSLPNCTDGANPSYSSVLFDSLGNLYGTTYGGGANGYGVVFELSPVGGSWAETVLYSFAGGLDGANPVNGLIMDLAGNLYGRTFYGGNGSGVVFELTPSGSDWTEKAIYAAETPASNAGLTMDGTGDIFGTTYSTVFKLSPNPNGGWNPTVLHTFTGAPKDGIDAEGTPALDQAGNLYGTTAAGGAKNLGTVYKLRPGKKGKWVERRLHSFNNQDTGSNPQAGIVFDAAGNVWGTTANGGADGGGIMFEVIIEPGTGGVQYKEHETWFFGWGGVGEYPVASQLMVSASELFCPLRVGGAFGYGMVFGYAWQ